jgi:hypothetical protein
LEIKPLLIFLSTPFRSFPLISHTLLIRFLSIKFLMLHFYNNVATFHIIGNRVSGLQEMLVDNKSSRSLRLEQLESEDNNALEALIKSRKNQGFVQVTTEAGVDRIRQILNDYPSKLALNLYLFFMEHLDGTFDGVVASQDLLAEEMGVTTRTIYTVTKWLEQKGAILRLKISGTVYAYCLNPDEVSKSWRSAKKYAAFNTKTLISVSENPGITRRVQIMLKDDKATLHQQDAPTSESKPPASKRRPPITK